MAHSIVSAINDLDSKHVGYTLCSDCVHFSFFVFFFLELECVGDGVVV